MSSSGSLSRRKVLWDLPSRLVLSLLAMACLTGYPAAASAQTTALQFDSEPGDWVGQGERRTWTATDLAFAAYPSGSGVITITASNFLAPVPVWWELRFQAPLGLPLMPGTYEYAASATAGISPGLMISGSGRGCTATGRFHVYEITRDDDGWPISFAADFEQHCQDDSPALFGAVRFNAARASLVPFDDQYPAARLRIAQVAHGVVTGPGIDCGSGQTDCEEAFAVGSQVALEAIADPGYAFIGWGGWDCAGPADTVVRITRSEYCLPVFGIAPGLAGAEPPEYASRAFVVDGNAPPSGSFTDAVAPRRYALVGPGVVIDIDDATTERVQFSIRGPYMVRWWIQFGAAPGEALVAGPYQQTAADAYRRGAAPLLNLTGASGCLDGGRFELLEIEFVSGVLTRFAADFELPCGVAPAMTAGSIRYSASQPRLRPFDGAYPSYSLNVLPTLGGFVTAPGLECGDGGRTDCDESYTMPGVVALQAVASPGYVFVGWSGDCEGRSAATTVSVDRHVRCLAAFTPAAESDEEADERLGVATLFIDAPGSTSTSYPATLLLMSPAVRATGSPFGRSVTVTFRGARGFETVSFVPPVVSDLGLGEYNEAYSSPNDFYPALTVSGCHAVRGRFFVYELERDSFGQVARFAADFEAQCSDPARPYVVGAVRLNARRAAVLPFDGVYPARRLILDRPPNGSIGGPGLLCGAGPRGDCEETFTVPTSVTLHAAAADGYRFVAWTGACSGPSVTDVVVDWTVRCGVIFEPVVAGAGFEDLRVRQGSFLVDSQPGERLGGGQRRAWSDVVIFASGRENLAAFVRLPDGAVWTLRLNAPAGQVLRPGAYDDARYPFADDIGSAAGIDMGSPAPTGYCVPATAAVGRFVIHELAYESASSPTVAALAVDFEFRCAADAPALYGAIRYHSQRGTLTPFAPLVTPAVTPPGDFNGDGHPDLVWRHAGSGGNAFWFMEGADLRATDWMRPSGAEVVTDPAWEIRGTGDFNGDGHPDIVWQHATNGKIATWLFSGGTRLATTFFTTLSGTSTEPDLDWTIAGAADFNRDGHADLLWRHRVSGVMRVWHMNRLEQWDSVDLPLVVANRDWQIGGVGDLDRDGWVDLVWRHYRTGALATWLMSDTDVVATLPLTPASNVDVSWAIVGVADMNRDGFNDLVWQNHANGRLGVWYMNGLSAVSTVLMTPHAVSDPNWRIVGVR